MTTCLQCVSRIKGRHGGIPRVIMTVIISSWRSPDLPYFQIERQWNRTFYFRMTLQISLPESERKNSQHLSWFKMTCKKWKVNNRSSEIRVLPPQLMSLIRMQKRSCKSFICYSNHVRPFTMCVSVCLVWVSSYVCVRGCVHVREWVCGAYFVCVWVCVKRLHAQFFTHLSQSLVHFHSEFSVFTRVINFFIERKSLDRADIL